MTTKALEELNSLLTQVSTRAKILTYGGILDFLKDPAVTLLVVKDGVKIIGMGTVITFHKISEKCARIEHIVLDEKYRGQGLGEKLTLKLIESARAKKVKQIELTSSSSRLAANKLYQKLGFEIRDTNVFRLKL